MQRAEGACEVNKRRRFVRKRYPPSEFRVFIKRSTHLPRFAGEEKVLAIHPEPETLYRA